MASPDRAGAGAGLILPLVLAVAAVIGLIALNLVPTRFDLDRSAIGFDGLVAWLSSTGVETRTFGGGDWLTRDRVGLRIYPLFNVDLGRQPPDSLPAPQPLKRVEQRTVALGVVTAKLAAAPTLVVLPKWRDEVIERGAVHPDLLVPTAELGALLAAVAPEAGAVLPRGQGFGRIESTAGEVALYSPQLVEAGTCTPVIGTAAAMLLGRCTVGKTTYWLLTDPDLVDNHGLTQGANAPTAAAILPRIADGGPVVVDLTTTALWDAPRPQPAERPARAWSDLLRYFGPPLTAAWAALALLLALVLWRASIRTGPIEAAADDGWRAARAVSIEARARLLRRSGHDARLVGVYASDRLQALAVDLFGRRRAEGDAFAAIGRLLQSTPALLAAFRQAFSRAAAGDVAGEAELLRRVDELTTTTERIRNEFGRAAKPRSTRPG